MILAVFRSEANEVAVEFFTVEMSKISKPMAASVVRIAFFPGMLVIENRREPPEGGLIVLKLDDNEPSEPTSQTARKPCPGGVPLTATINEVPSSLKTIWLAEPAGPVAGVVWLMLRERKVLAFGTRPRD